MKLRRITAIATVGITLALLLAMFLIAQKVLLTQYEILEEQHVFGDMQLTLNLLRTEMAVLDRTAKDYASWDSTYAYMAKRDLHFETSDVSDDTFANINVRTFMLLDTKSAVVLLRSIGHGEIKRDTNEIVRAAAMLTRREIGHGTTGILVLSDGPVMAAMRPILTTANQGPARGILIMTRAIDAKLLSALSSTVQMPLQLIELDKSQPRRWAKALNSAIESPGIERKANYVRAFRIIPDIWGSPKLGLQIEHARDIWAEGKRAVRLLLCLLALVGLIFGVLNLLMMDHYVVARLIRLSQVADEIQETGGLKARVKIKGRDEIAQLGHKMNQMLDQIQRSNETLLTVQEQLRYQATHDSLTGTWNRPAALELLDREIARCSRERSTVGVILLDLDHFKDINDRFGHSGGDQVLMEVTAAIARMLRSFDTLARYGGEEFVIVAPNCNLTEAESLAQRILQRLANSTVRIGDQDVQVTASAGVTAGDGSYTSENLIGIADRAMYAAKAQGRNCTVCEAPPTSDEIPGLIFAPNRVLRAM